MTADNREYICDLKVKYGDSASDAPLDSLREVTGLSNNLNHRYGGRFVWLVPTYTRDVNAAATSFHVVVQNNSDNKMQDLAKGAGGGYRYIFSRSDSDEPKKIVHAVLLRSSTGVSSPPPGWDMITADINKGRRKSRLYILLKTYGEESKPLLSVTNVSGYLSPRNSGIAREYIERLDVVYGENASSAPSDCIREVHGFSSEIMVGEGGKHVWLVPVTTTELYRAATSFDTLIQPYQDQKLSDLAKGAGGEFRYVVPRADRKLASKITEVALYRSERPVKSAPVGWDGYSAVNILKGRPKGHLHLVWKTASTNSWSFTSLVSMSPFRAASTISPYISRLKVVYGDELEDMPEEAIYEFNGQSADINYQFGGKFVWLTPEYTTDPQAAAAAFEVSIQSIADLAFDDLAKGSGGDFRYVEPKYDANARAKVTEVQLLRSDTPLSTPPAGWQGMTDNINAGRQRTHLYVIWKTV